MRSRITVRREPSPLEYRGRADSLCRSPPIGGMRAIEGYRLANAGGRRFVQWEPSCIVIHSTG
jgi:hypothetical protein